MSLQIRPASAQDLHELELFARALFRRIFSYIPYSEANLRLYDEAMLSVRYFSRFMDDEGVLVARDDARLVGYAIAGAMSLPVENPTEPSREIVRLYVLPDYHGTGLAQRFMSHLLRDAEHCTYYLSVYHENHRAQAFYAKYGFEKIGEYDYFVGHHIDREWIMRRVPQPLV